MDWPTSLIKLYSKRNCAACKLVRERLQQFGVSYNEIFDHQIATPTVEYRRQFVRPPITTRKLKDFLQLHKLM
jgi:arsenate reductase-like glutaredoxin family protein